ncbi:MAG: RNA methyltransferase [Pirellulales bacterium]|nr:RNA methyltransferase [Pirellulales bacterium]
MAKITSLQNPRVKAALRLRDARRRQKDGRFLIDGLRELDRARQAGVELVEVFYCLGRCPAGQAAAAQALLARIGAQTIELGPAVFDKLAFGQRAEGVMAVAQTPRCRLADVALRDDPLVAVLEGIEKPGNVGAVLRSADAAGVDLVILADGRTDLFNPNAIRASIGTIFTVPVCEATADETLDWLRARGLAILAALVDGSTAYTDADYRRGAAIVLGSEAHGLSDAWRADDIRPVRLPMLGAADSLNISATAAVLFYEALRQRTQNAEPRP